MLAFRTIGRISHVQTVPPRSKAASSGFRLVRNRAWDTRPIRCRLSGAAARRISALRGRGAASGVRPFAYLCDEGRFAESSIVLHRGELATMCGCLRWLGAGAECIGCPNTFIEGHVDSGRDGHVSRAVPHEPLGMVAPSVRAQDCLSMMHARHVISGRNYDSYL